MISLLSTSPPSFHKYFPVFRTPVSTVLFPLFDSLDGLAEELCVVAGLLSPKVWKIDIPGHLPISS